MSSFVLRIVECEPPRKTGGGVNHSIGRKAGPALDGAWKSRPNHEEVDPVEMGSGGGFSTRGRRCPRPAEGSRLCAGFRPERAGMISKNITLLQAVNKPKEVLAMLPQHCPYLVKKIGPPIQKFLLGGTGMI